MAGLLVPVHHRLIVPIRPSIVPNQPPTVPMWPWSVLLVRASRWVSLQHRVRDGIIRTVDCNEGKVDGDIGTLGGDIGPLDGRMGPADGDIGTIDGWMGTVDGVIGTVDGGPGTLRHNETGRQPFRADGQLSSSWSIRRSVLRTASDRWSPVGSR
ncbi:hypothetical protein [Williamsia limnetica]|uniref:hypothetical protein n=1 Tax=Williamsia limnetica TaxID=882452 RepID=UPI000D7C999A|nr:hypothetical protein [Williamsia limnetica]